VDSTHLTLLAERHQPDEKTAETDIRRQNLISVFCIRKAIAEQGTMPDDSTPLFSTVAVIIDYLHSHP
jgi:hypothetical protein